MKRLIILAAVAAVAVVSANCANSREGGASSNIMAPSAVDSSGVVSTQARGGGHGGGKPGGGGGTGGSGSITLRMVTDSNNDGLPSFRDVLTFDVQTTATAYPWVTLNCSQNGTMVSTVANGIFATSLLRDFTLGPTVLWTGGAATCTATVHAYGSSTALASMSFPTN